MVQEIIAFTALGIALAFLIRKYFFKKTRAKGEQSGAKRNGKDCGGDCGCS